MIKKNKKGKKNVEYPMLYTARSKRSNSKDKTSDAAVTKPQKIMEKFHSIPTKTENLSEDLSLGDDSACPSKDIAMHDPVPRGCSEPLSRCPNFEAISTSTSAETLSQ